MANGRNNSRVDAGPLVLVAAMLHLHLDLAVRRIGAEPERLGLRDVWDGKGVATRTSPTHAISSNKTKRSILRAGNAGGWNMKQLIYVIQSTVQGRIIRRLGCHTCMELIVDSFVYYEGK